MASGTEMKLAEVESHLHQHLVVSVQGAAAFCIFHDIPRLQRACIVGQGRTNKGTCRSPCAHVPQALLLLATTQLHGDYPIGSTNRAGCKGTMYVAKISRAAAWNVDDRRKLNENNNNARLNVTATVAEGLQLVRHVAQCPAGL